MTDNLLTILQLIQPVVVTAAAAVGAIVAYLGLQSWRRQLKGRTEYDLARRFLTATLRARDALSNLRVPLITGGEMHAAAQAAGLPLDDDGFDPDAAHEAARQARWRRVQEAVTELRIEELAAEVLWGEEVSTCTDDLRQLIRNVSVAEEEYRHRTQGVGPRTPEDRQRIPELRRIMYATGGENDPTGRRLDEAVRKVENQIRPKLRP